MKTTVKIPKNILYAPIDYNDVALRRIVCGVRLSYTEYDFIQMRGRPVLFDAYSAAHTYAPFDIECGVIAFPFYCGCMTDDGERVAYAGLRFNEERAQKWIPLRSKSVLEQLAADPTAGGIPITSGVCCLSDENGYAEYRKHIKDEIHPLAGLIVLDGQTHVELELCGGKYAAFSTGWGDGRFNCYAGIAENGAVTSIIADFGMIEYVAPDDSLVEVEIDIKDNVGLFVYDPKISEAENNIKRHTVALDSASNAVEKLRAYSRRGYAYHSLGDIDSAIADYIAATECCHEVTDRHELMRAWSVYDNAAEIFCARSDYDSAIKLMLDALEINDEFNAGAYVRLIDLYRIVKREDKALETAAKMCAARSADPVAHMKYAECCVSVLDYAGAAEEYELLASRFELYENLFEVAACFIELGDCEKAYAALERHPAKDAYEQYWYYMAYIAYKQHRFADALELARKSREIDSEYMPPLYLLIDIESLMNEYRAVARYAEEYKKLRPDNEYGYGVCAEAHLMLGNFSECARNYCYLYDVVKSDDMYGALAAIVCGKTGESKRSKSILKRLKRKKSAYYAGAAYGVKQSRVRDSGIMLEKTMSLFDAENDFLIILTAFLLQTDRILQATRLLDILSKDENRPYEIVALQIRAAEKIDDKKCFLSFLEYYINKFVNRRLTNDERKKIGAAFISDRQKHLHWLDEIV